MPSRQLTQQDWRRARVGGDVARHPHERCRETSGPIPVGAWRASDSIETLLSQVTVCGSRQAVRRLFEDVAGLKLLVGRLLIFINERGTGGRIRVRANEDSPQQLVVEFPAGGEHMATLDAIDRWMIAQPGSAHNRVIVDVYYA